MVMAQSLYIYLRNQNHKAAVDVLAPAWSVGLLARMPEVRSAYVLEVAHGELGLRKRWQVAKKLGDIGYQRAIILPRSFKSALIPFWAKIPQRTGFNTELRHGLVNDRRTLHANLDQTVKRFVALGRDPQSDTLAQDCPRPRLTVDKNNATALLSRLRLDIGNPVAGLMPGAEYGPAKQWPPEYFGMLAVRLVEQGYSVWIFGSNKERELGDRIAAESAGNIINLCGRTSLIDVVDLIAQLHVAVTNDSGLMHIAAAVDIPLIALYGSSSPLYTPPLSQQAIVKYLDLDCSPCFKRRCPYGHYACLKELSVGEIVHDIKRIED